MQLLELTLDTPAANLALDEALLERAEQGEGREVLRLWESADDFVVLGRSSDLAEVNQAACQEEGVGIFRRGSGGGVVLVGPGCLMFSVVLEQSRLSSGEASGLVDAGRIDTGLINIDAAHRYVLDRTAAAVRQVLATSSPAESTTVQRAGTSDLSLEKAGGKSLKFSGNSLRVKRRHLLYHGTLLYDFDLSKIARLLAAPKRMPDYRAGRTHASFVTNLQAGRKPLGQALIQQWQAGATLEAWPRERTGQLAGEYEPL
ncbi:lipoate--protein ligase family protein [Adhaeretor mobilis]|uniref:Putative lipoate-protein ligase A n=1 Tax=Adhaeretor mobilis TaxID=1930276 RepID=A0A517N2R5_9BACT|nr:lipoate--protein ligase family protein [Adhaeretor mobilis]QDT01298.1 putative lipoate-protein ligase A [Adhaeretor mobilis]